MYGIYTHTYSFLWLLLNLILASNPLLEKLTIINKIARSQSTIYETHTVIGKFCDLNFKFNFINFDTHFYFTFQTSIVKFQSSLFTTASLIKDSILYLIQYCNSYLAKGLQGIVKLKYSRKGHSLERIHILLPGSWCHLLDGCFDLTENNIHNKFQPTEYQMSETIEKKLQLSN